MDPERISLYDAKRRFSEIVRRVRERGELFEITYHGQPVAAITPYAPDTAVTLSERIARLEAAGEIVARSPGRFPEPVANVPAAVAEFLAERD